MLTKNEIQTIRRFMLRVQPTQSKDMQSLMPELQAWQVCVNALDREEAAIDPEGVAQRKTRTKAGHSKK